MISICSAQNAGKLEIFIRMNKIAFAIGCIRVHIIINEHENKNKRRQDFKCIKLNNKGKYLSINILNLREICLEIFKINCSFSLKLLLSGKVQNE